MVASYTPPQGAIVIYTSATGSATTFPAVVLRTQSQPIVEPGPRPDGTVPQLPDDKGDEYFARKLEPGHVDLLVHGLLGDYREWNVPYDDHRGPRSWSVGAG